MTGDRHRLLMVRTLGGSWRPLALLVGGTLCIACSGYIDVDIFGPIPWCAQHFLEELDRLHGLGVPTLQRDLVEA
ncbi:hypothetical protein LCGC14_0272980 [marine sediment metagenome]|uniref:Uncharacterized protein n=1 Tax=marine sediment metagenome TaxID=412755 RepID=A0A0F9UEW0_9ZZZZ